MILLTKFATRVPLTVPCVARRWAVLPCETAGGSHCRDLLRRCSARYLPAAAPVWVTAHSRSASSISIVSIFDLHLFTLRDCQLVKISTARFGKVKPWLNLEKACTHTWVHFAKGHFQSPSCAAFGNPPCKVCTFNKCHHSHARHYLFFIFGYVVLIIASSSIAWFLAFPRAQTAKLCTRVTARSWHVRPITVGQKAKNVAWFSHSCSQAVIHAKIYTILMRHERSLLSAESSASRQVRTSWKRN